MPTLNQLFRSRKTPYTVAEAKVGIAGVKKQLQIFENKLDEDLIVDVEMYPDRYVLKPGDVLHITYDHDGDGYGLHTIVHNGALQIYLQHFDTAVVTISGKPAEPWS
ncbi:hypothetical protein [Asticcacaulis excentricus]|uniref:Uncharacterized protein n=1 Tax=Asticcacaulis excentricus (strain ATCC 15261 / DSM 4724 / KCTC 12464 / NCIMB 9791 / VKM B-1370 / CB 48) TaxID=573065 RepID=E8RNA1_ASTEC|nr:hypothetical protein [Asticcacaulis excentricus]ADU14000.1 hypothetical protein Astex_2347 [Asticcacaulis excentricus CB 48]